MRSGEMGMKGFEERENVVIWNGFDEYTGYGFGGI